MAAAPVHRVFRMVSGSASFAPGPRVLILMLWLLSASVMIAINWQYITALYFLDPDDALRLVQVRDLLAGQSWFDSLQHRIHPPTGVPMHWSRLVDLPIASMLALLTPMLGVALAERVTLVAIPLLMLLALCFIVHATARALGLHRGPALLAVILLLSSASILIRFAPMRIDHHGMQIVMGALAMLALTRADWRDGRAGLLAGVAMAGWLQISIEGLPYAVLVGSIFGLRHVARTDRWPDLLAYLAALTGLSAILLFGTHTPADALFPWCDSVSPAYLVPLALAAIVLIGAQRAFPGGTRLQRSVPLALAGGAGLAAFLALSRQCLAGPFDTLDPLVYRHWYLSVREGLPLTAQTPDMQAMIVLPSLLGLVGSIIGLRRAAHGPERMAWVAILILQFGALAVSLSVMRAMSFAHLVALPGNAVLLGRLVAAAQRLRFMPLRVSLTAATAIATPLGAVSATAALHHDQEAGDSEAAPRSVACASLSRLRGLSALPPATLFTPLDIGAHVLAYTHHAVIGTGHHRNIEGMKMVIEGMTATPSAAQAIVARAGADYVVLCAQENEVRKYRQLNPRGLAAVLASGNPPEWLELVPMRPGESVLVYRVRLRAR
ncbi:hypothetical protein [Sphingobium sp. SYK-6]|uniref:hypothetical protein n=1 Tax=Sphingobium sp. (strain NBRC 103272 / SYK-6) TaxID=627192 RepID=UPI0011D265F1|nr:hypothetical protein [Sphingobium sp. SYK-6]